MAGKNRPPQPGTETKMQTKRLAENYDLLAPDKSQIRLLAAMERGSMVHCTLPGGETSLAVVHETVEEVWYFIGGSGQVWRKVGTRQEGVEVGSGTSLTIPTGAHFQFRNTGKHPLCFIIVTMPPWPGAQEARRVPEYWPDF